MNKTSVILVAFLIAFASCGDFNCVHGDEYTTVDNVMVIESSSENVRRQERRAARQNLRIFVDISRLDTTTKKDKDYTCYDVGQTVTTQDGNTMTCTSADILTTASANLARRLIADGVVILQNALLVDRETTNLKLSPNLNCYPGGYVKTTPDSDYTTNGNGVPNTDLFLFATARKVLTAGVLAFAGECSVISNGRSIAGYINFNPSSLTGNADEPYVSNLGAAVHEMTHVLGFASAKYDSFIYPNGSIIPRNEVLVFETPEPGRTVAKIKTPKVLAKVREHFGCPTMTGAEIENQGTNGTAYSHWEKRIYGNEYMVGVTTGNPVVSELTIALLEDSGWYTGNYAAVSPLRWGYKQGCAFVNSRCNTWSGEGYFCSSVAAKSCNFDRTAKSQCFLSNYNTIPNQYQYFSDPTLGGADLLADFCPYYDQADYSKGLCTDGSSSSSYLDMGEQYGNTSRCFDSSMVKNSPTGYKTIQACYAIACTSSQTMKIKVGPYWYDCPVGGVVEDPGDYTGKLQCPVINNLCVNAPVDNSWPTFISVNPSNGAPSEEVEIKGTNFVPGMTIYIDALAECSYIDNQTYHCKVAGQNKFRNPKHLLGTHMDVTMVYPTSSGDKSCSGVKAFYLKVNFGKGFAAQMGYWMQDNPIITAVVIGAGVLGCMACCYCCYRERKRMLNKDEDN